MPAKTNLPNAIQGVLFDLDGTLLDTIPDLVAALNYMRQERKLSALTDAFVRPLVSLGSKAMIASAFSVRENDPKFNLLREQFLAYYADNIAHATKFFPNVDKLLTHLDDLQIPWGIVTNKLTRHTLSLLTELRIAHRPACVVCGDTLATAKPAPEPIWHACEMLNLKPQQCLYVGDAATDVLASKAAGTTSLVALYGYIQDDEDPYTWQADGYVQDAIEVIDWLSS